MLLISITLKPEFRDNSCEITSAIESGGVAMMQSCSTEVFSPSRSSSRSRARSSARGSESLIETLTPTPLRASPIDVPINPAPTMRI